MDKLQAKIVIRNECQFGFIYSNEPNIFHLLTGSVLRGDAFRIHDHATIPITKSDTIRLGTSKDFDDYRIERTQYSKSDCVNEYVYDNSNYQNINSNKL